MGNEVASSLRDELHELVALYQKSDWHRLQLGALILRLKEQMDFNHDLEVYELILTLEEFSLDKLRDVKRCAAAYEYFYREEIPTSPSANPKPGNLSGQNMWSPLAKFCKPVIKAKRAEQKKTLALVGEVIDDAFSRAKAENRAISLRDVKAALKASPLAKKDVSRKATRADWLTMMEKLGALVQIEDTKDLPFNAEEFSFAEWAFEELADKILQPPKDPPQWIDRLDRSFDNIWCNTATRLAGISNALKFIALHLPRLDGKEDFYKITLYEWRVTKLTYRTFLAYSKELASHFQPPDNFVAVDPFVLCKHGIHLEENGSYAEFHDCCSLLLGGLVLAVENICRSTGFPIPDVDLGEYGTAIWDARAMVWRIQAKPPKPKPASWDVEPDEAAPAVPEKTLEKVPEPVLESPTTPEVPPNPNANFWEALIKPYELGPLPDKPRSEPEWEPISSTKDELQKPAPAEGDDAKHGTSGTPF